MPDVPDELDELVDAPLATHVPARQVSPVLHEPLGRHTAPAAPALVLPPLDEDDAGSSPTHATIASADDAAKATTAST